MLPWKLCNPGRGLRAGWDAQAGAGSMMVTDQGSQELLTGQASGSMENTGRVQGNQPTHFCSL